jgi:hypothetical protein
MDTPPTGIYAPNLKWRVNQPTSYGMYPIVPIVSLE